MGLFHQLGRNTRSILGKNSGSLNLDGLDVIEQFACAIISKYFDGQCIGVYKPSKYDDRINVGEWLLLDMPPM